jgi:MFS transporter, DHA1 family, tetracycline resistance protein
MSKTEPRFTPEAKPDRSAITFVLITLVINAMGFGIIIPVLPDLIAEVSGTSISGAALWGGYLSFSFAAMQFLVGPTVGNLSDRFGRRPVLLCSLGILALDFLIMALASSLAMLFLGRILSGIAAATNSTANAFMADISSKEQRAKNFGLLGAAFGFGFIIGPVIGGIAGEYGTRAPFYTAAALAFANFCFGLIVLPETLETQKRRPFQWLRANPVGGLKQVAKIPMVAWFMVTVFLFETANFVYPSVWAYYTKETFKWSTSEVGLSLAAVGAGIVIVQGWLIRHVLRFLGETRTFVAGAIIGISGMIGLTFATEGWMFYMWLPAVALAGMATPAISALMSNVTPDDAQGELQGVRSSVIAIVTIISPVLMTQLFGHFTKAGASVYFPGAPFLVAAALAVLAFLPFCIGVKRNG